MNKAYIPVDQILDGAKEQELIEVLVLGWDEDSNLYAASSSGRVDDIRELIRAVEQRVLKRAVLA